MRGKILFITGLAAGYVLGTRAGRKRYEQIKAAAQSVWHTAPVQHSLDSARDFARGSVGDVGEIALDALKRLIRIAGSAAKRTGDVADDVVGDVAETLDGAARDAARAEAAPSGTRAAAPRTEANQ